MPGRSPVTTPVTTPVTSPIATPVATIPVRRIPTAIIPRRRPSPAESPSRTCNAPIPAPVPPQRVRRCRENICIQSVFINIPVPRSISPVYNIPIKRAAYRYGISRTAETYDSHGIFIIILRTFETVNPLSTLSIRLLFDIQCIVLHRKGIIA